MLACSNSIFPSLSLHPPPPSYQLPWGCSPPYRPPTPQSSQPAPDTNQIITSKTLRATLQHLSSFSVHLPLDPVLKCVGVASSKFLSTPTPPVSATPSGLLSHSPPPPRPPPHLLFSQSPSQARSAFSFPRTPQTSAFPFSGPGGCRASRTPGEKGRTASPAGHRTVGQRPLVAGKEARFILTGSTGFLSPATLPTYTHCLDWNQVCSLLGSCLHPHLLINTICLEQFWTVDL